ncbi:MAG: zinc ribbon domain-containing protein [Candidatus Thorarchaeota archaeon]
MTRSKGVTISVKVPINWDALTRKKQQRLRQILGRDMRVIRAFLGVIEQHEDELLTGRNKQRIHDGKLDRLTLTAVKVKAGFSQRLIVPHDFKARFPRISRNELSECRQTAVALYESYVALREKKTRKTSRPCEVNSTRRIPRWTFSVRFKLLNHKTKVANLWLDLRDSLDSVRKGKKYHDRLLFPLKVSPFHHDQFIRGPVKAAQVFTDRDGKWWATFAVRVETPESPNGNLPFAVLGIDLGIDKAACSTLVTPEKVRETKYFRRTRKLELIRKLDQQVAHLQRETNKRRNSGFPHDKLALKLRKIRGKRERVAKEYDRLLVKQMREYILRLSQEYVLYVAVGRLANIRQLARKGNHQGRRFRGMIHSWSFARITKSLKHQLAQLGWSVTGKDSRFRVVPENWTSIMCWKCGQKGMRPKQNLFVCPTCGNKCNADMNGAINIAGRLITLTDSLHSVRGLGKWTSAIARSKRPKTQGKKSQGKSLLSKASVVSHLGESAAVHSAQMSLPDFGDRVGMDDNDPAVASSVESFTVAGRDMPASRQEKEARSSGGISSR